MTSPLYLIELRPGARELVRFAKGQGINASRDEDLGYTAHAWLAALFGKLSPKPFRVLQDCRGTLRVLGYTPHGREELLEAAESFALPEATHVCALKENLLAKTMPGGWREGRRLGFEVLLCPVTRKESAEKDVYLRQCDRLEEGQQATPREEVYRGWLAKQLEAAASLERAELAAFRLIRMLRRPQPKHGGPRAAGPLTLPQALFRGTLEVRDDEAFQNLLRRGVGRHRAFGYGMLLLRPPA